MQAKLPACFLFLLLLPAALCGCTHESKDMKQGALSHHAENGFRNPYLETGKRGFFSYLKMRYFSGVEYPDYQENAYKVPTVKPDLDLIRNPRSAPQVTWIGHATVLVQYSGMALLTDPIFSDRASPISFLGPKRVHPPAPAIDELPDIDYVIISHNHYDHLDRKTVQKLGSAPFWLVPLGLREWLIDAGIAPERIAELDWWQSRRFDGTTVTATPAQHWSSRALWDRRETLWSSWMVQVDDFTFWFSGDTGYNGHQFKKIGAGFRRVDLGLISIGAYAPRWFMKDMHINPEEAVRISREIGAEYSIGIQWGTFRMTAEPIDEPPRRLREALREHDIPLSRFEALKIGETKILPGEWKHYER
jgi:N-acyl-phosphatidylethanolamine-hydrolysing phospholipase D